MKIATRRIKARGNSHAVSLPKAWMRELGWDYDDWVVLELEEGMIKLSRAESLETDGGRTLKLGSFRVDLDKVELVKNEDSKKQSSRTNT
jgi:hypothetical protein